MRVGAYLSRMKFERGCPSKLMYLLISPVYEMLRVPMYPPIAMIRRV
jgi:hypothetical protein